MPLNNPSSEDIKKINSEINQLVNQRFIVTTFAITIFGVIFAWLIPKFPPSNGLNTDWVVYISLILMILLLFGLYLFSHFFLRGMLRIYTTYLIATNSSNWENDWKKYREKYGGYHGYTKGQSLIFLLLGVFVFLFILFYTVAYSTVNEQNIIFFLSIFTLGLSIAYCISVFLIGFRGCLDPELNYLNNWQSL